MATVNTLGADILSLRGADDEYHRISRFFRTRAEAAAALASSDWVPTPGVVNVCITGDEGILLYDADDTVNGMLSNLDGPARTYIDEQVSALVGDSPELLNTLSEIADALGDDPAFFQTIQTRVADIEDGYDFTGAISAPVAGNVIPFYYADQTQFPNATGAHGALAHSHADGAMYFAHGGAWHELALNVDLSTNSATTNALVDLTGVADGSETLGTFTGTTIPDTATIKEALQALETTLEAVDLDTDDMAALVGLSENVTNLGTFTGSTITDGTDVKGALQELETAVETNDAALDGRLDVLEADATTQTAVDAVIATVTTNETDIEGKVSDVNSALGISVGDTGFEFNEDLVLIDIPDLPLPDYNTVFSSLTVDAADAAQTISLKTAIDRLAKNSRLALRAEKIRLDAEDARVSGLIGVNGDDQNLGTFTGSSIADNVDVKTALQSLETATEGEVSARTAIAEFASNLTKLKNDLRGTYINVGNNIELRASAGGRVEIVGDLYLDNNTAINGSGTTLTSFENINAYDGRIAALEADPTTATALAAVQADVDQNEADADAAIAAEGARALAAEALLAPLASPALTGTPTAPTATAGTNTTQLATTEYVSTAVANLIDGAPGAIDTLNELAAAIGDDANFSTTITNSIAAVQSDVDQNEVDGDAADAALSARIDTLEADPTTATALAAVQADVDQNETDGDAADAALSARIDTLEADPTTATALAAVQADVDQNESDADAADAALSARLDTLEADPVTKAYVDGTTTTEALTRQAQDTTLQNNIDAVQADVDQNEADADAAIALKADIASPTFTGTPAAPTATAGTNTTQLATTAFVSTAVANLVDGAPGAIDTLNELAAALGDDPNFATTITNSIAAVQADVDQNETDADAAIALKLDASAVSTFGGTLIDDADAAAARTTLGVDAAGTDNSTDVTLAAGLDYLTIAGQEITLGSVDLTTDVTGALPVANGGTGATDVAGAQAALSVDHLITLSGVAEAADDLGTFSGSTISDSGTVKAALQELETALETKAPDTDLTALETTVGNISGGVTSTTYAFDSGTSAEPGSKDIRYNNTTPANVTEIYISKTNKAGVDLSNVIPEMLFAGVRIYLQSEDDASQYLAATITSVTEVNATYTLGVNEVSAGSLIGNNKKTAFAVIGKTPLDLGTFSGSTIADNATPKEALQALETAIEGNDSDISTLQTHTGNQEATLGVAATANNLGTFTGATINDNVSVKVALQALETAQEATQADVDQNESDADAAIAAVIAGTSIPGPYNNDTEAGNNGVTVGAIYKNSNGTIHWRVS